MGGFDLPPARRGLRALLRVIARFCLRHSLRIQDVHEYMKLAFIEEAARESRAQTGRVNISRLSITTGIHRKDIERLYRDAGVREMPKSLAGRVIVEWQTNKRFCAANGRPRVLSVTDDTKGFRSLVLSVSAELNPATVLYELERVHAVERSESGVKLVKQSYVPEGDAEKGFSLLAADADDLVAAVEENILSSARASAPNLHVKTEFDRVSEDSLEEIREWLLVHGSALQKRFRNFVAKFDCDHNAKLDKTRCTARVALGTFGRVHMTTAEKEDAA